MKKRKAQAVIYYCAQNNTKHFLLLKMNKKRSGFWQNVTGSVEKFESFKDGAIRESIEETGIDPKNIKSVTNLDMKFEFIDQWEKNVEEEVFLIQASSIWDVEIDSKEHQSFKWIEENQITENSVHFKSNYLALMRARDHI